MELFKRIFLISSLICASAIASSTIDKTINSFKAPGGTAIQVPSSGVFPNSVLTPPTVYAWSGHHAGALWHCPASSFGDCTGNASVTFTVDNNVNFGTVTSYVDGSSNPLPGITFVAPATGIYQINFLADVRNATTGDAALFEIVDQSGTVLSRVYDNSISTLQPGLYMPGSGHPLYQMTSGTTYTLKIWTQVGGGGDLQLGLGGVFNSDEWSIFKIN